MTRLANVVLDVSVKSFVLTCGLRVWTREFNQSLKHMDEPISFIAPWAAMMLFDIANSPNNYVRVAPLSVEIRDMITANIDQSLRQSFYRSHIDWPHEIWSLIVACRISVLRAVRASIVGR
jgi:hypothetical protein